MQSVKVVDLSTQNCRIASVKRAYDYVIRQPSIDLNDDVSVFSDFESKAYNNSKEKGNNDLWSKLIFFDFFQIFTNYNDNLLYVL